MALGAQGRRVRGMVVAHGTRVAVAGIVVGLVVSLAGVRVLESLLFGVETLDPLTFASIGVVMLGVTVLACYLPSRRASSVDPMQTLRAD